MNKKFLSAILFGALMVTSTGTFVSCKDYDDDIENLQGQIDNLATKSDVEAKLAQLQAALNAAQAESSANAADIAALEKEVASMMTKVEAAVESEIAEYKTEIEALVKKVETLVGEVADFVTSVEFVDSYTAANGNWVNADKRGHVVVSTTIEKDNVFSKDIANAITFEKGKERQTPNSFLVRVSPTNAVLTKDMISLVNSKGQSLEDVMEVVKVEKADILLSREQAAENEETADSRAATNHGLWTISVQAKNYGDGKAFNAATTVKNSDGTYNDILFATQVNNSLASAEARYVTSTYDLSFGWTPYVPAASLNYFVGEKNVKFINNRYDSNSKSLKETGAPITYNELAWSGDPAVAAITETKGDNVKNVDTDANDNRSDVEYLYPAVQGKAFKIALSTVEEKIKAPSNIRAIYVTLDKANAVESAPSELNAWNSYNYKGLNTVVEGTSTEITIDAATSINDIIGFRVYAVNYDGTLVDPDGKAFYVLVGDKAADWKVVATTIVPENETVKGVYSETVAVDLTKLTGATKATWTTDKIKKNEVETQPVFHVAFLNKDGEAKFGTNSMIGEVDIDFSKIVEIRTEAATGFEWCDYVDNKAYNGTLTISNATDHVLATINVTFTKVLPNKPEGYSIKTSQLNAEGIYNCYLVPAGETWAPTIAEGTMPMNDVFNWGEGELSRYLVSFAEADKTDDDKLKAATAKGGESVVIAEEFIDNETKHATTVTYNFGKISSEAKDKDGKIIDYVVTMDEFPTVFNCIYNNTYSWHWATIEEMAAEHGNKWAEKNNDGSYKYAAPSTSFKYGVDYWFTTPVDGIKFGIDQAIQGVSSRDTKYNAMLFDPYLASLEYAEGHVYTVEGNKKDEYFTVEKDSEGNLYFKATTTSVNTNTNADIPSRVELTYTDMYGHDIVIKLDVTITVR